MLPISSRPSRRDVLALLAATTTATSLPLRVAAQGSAEAPGSATPFSFDALAEEMRASAARPWVAPALEAPWWGDLDYDGYRMIRFRDWQARWQDEGDWRLAAFHMGWLYPEPVRVYDVADGEATEMVFSTEDFDYFGTLGAKVPADGALPGVAGFRLNWPLNRPGQWDEVASFVGASYFRALGRGNVYGSSARGLVVNTWVSEPEEFPSFTRFYLSPRPDACTIWAALEGRSVTGAFEFVMRPGAVTEMDVRARLFFREAVEELGIAPLTSMFLFSGQNRHAFDDYRPNVHDSDGLRVERTDDEVVWRPLNNPHRLGSSYFGGAAPRSFGLYQRDRTFESYQDSGARYDLRPSVEVVPVGDWGAGAVRLVEIPSAIEANDNIVAFWVPERTAEAGDEIELAYRLRWGDLQPHADDPLAIVVETRAGAGGVSGVEADENVRKFVVDFRGGHLAALPADAPVAPVLGIANGHEVFTILERLPDSDIWRAIVDVGAERGAIVELNLHLAGFGERLSETWAFQWINT